jgi:hypothetical protein
MDIVVRYGQSYPDVLKQALISQVYTCLYGTPYKDAKLDMGISQAPIESAPLGGVHLRSLSLTPHPEAVCLIIRVAHIDTHPVWFVSLAFRENNTESRIIDLHSVLEQRYGR